MKNIALELCYDGHRYHGWQTQKNLITVQETLSDAIELTTGSRPVPELAGCGRTDAGVSANMYVASFRSDTVIPIEKLPFALFPHLPEDISVRKAKEVPAGFHARFSAIRKEYVYRLYHSYLPIPSKRFTHGFSYLPFDIDRMNEAAKKIIGTHDFSAFCASGSSVKNNERTVFRCEVQGDREECSVTISADGFLYNMVRIICGTLCAVSSHKMEPDDIDALLSTGNRTEAGITLPPQGLSLNRIWYGNEPGLDGITASVRQF